MERQLNRRLEAHAHDWRVVYDRVITTPTSILAFGTQRDQPVVLKVVRNPGDEWHGGAVAAAFDGRGIVRVIAHQPGAVLLEQIAPATQLVDLVRRGDDDGACAVIAHVIHEMQRVTAGEVRVATAEDLGNGFVRYLASGDAQIELSLVADAQQLYAHLCSTQRRPRLVHGDLQHYNILYDERRGWMAIDPKGVIAELEFELGAALRNPHGVRALFSDASMVEHRIRLMTRGLQIDVQRAMQWAFAQAALSAIWTIEDNSHIDPADPGLMLASALLDVV